jgi:hypothetical protein
MILQIFNLALGLAFLQASRAQMLIVEFDIAQGTQKPTTGRTRYRRFFCGMIKTTGFFFTL